MNEVHHLPQPIIKGAVILLGTFGIAAMIAWMPIPTDEAGVIFALEKLRAPIDAKTHTPPAQTQGNIHGRLKCEECGVVESTREIEQLDEDIAPGAAGVEKRGSWNEISGRSGKSYEVTIRMKNGSSHVFMDTTPVHWRPGERLIFIEGAKNSND